jgi:cytochrome c oxidase subunit 3
MEYVKAPFRMSNGIYGSTFFLAMGFHGYHVIISTIFLIIYVIWTFYLNASLWL